MGRKVVLSTWDPGAFSSETGEQVLLQMMAAALRFERVVIFDQSLALTRALASFFVKGPLNDTYKRNRLLVEELFETGIFEIRLLAPEHYPDSQLAELSVRSPIRARGWMVQKNATFELFKDQWPMKEQAPFDAKDWLFDEFYSWIDPLIERTAVGKKANPSSSLSSSLPARVRNEVAAILRLRSQETSRALNIPVQVLERFADLTMDLEKALELLGNADIPSPERLIHSPRKLLNELSAVGEFRPYSTNLRRFTSGVFVAVFCSDENAAGTYSSIVLEPSVPEDRSFSEPFEALTKETRNFSLRPGLGRALLRAREQPEIKGLLTSSNSFDQTLFEPSIELYVEAFNREYQRETIVAPIEANLHTLKDVAGTIGAIAATVSPVMALTHHQQGAAVAGAVSASMNLLKPALAHVSERVILPIASCFGGSTAKSELTSLLQERCRAVPLLSEAKIAT